MQVSLKEIMVQYATQKGGGLPLSPQEICNSVVQWVQEYTASTLVDVDKIKVQTLESLIEGSETVVVDLNEEGTKLEIHLDYEVVQKLDRALLLPLSPPANKKMVVINTNNEQELADLDVKYKHNLVLNQSGGAYVHLCIKSSIATALTTENVISEIRNGSQWWLISAAVGDYNVVSFAFDTSENTFTLYYFYQGSINMEPFNRFTVQTDTISEV